MGIVDIEKIISSLDRLTPADREWILKNLSEEEKIQLDAYLNTLAPSPLPAEEKKAAKTASVSSVYNGKQHDKSVESLKTALVDQLSKLLRHEPAWVSAVLLDSQTWPWAAEYLADLNRDRISALQAVMAKLSSQTAPRLRSVLIELINEAYEQRTVKKAEPSYFDRLLEQANEIKQRSLRANRP